MAEHEFDALGTRWLITTKDTLNPTITSRLHAVADQFDRTYSRFRRDSLVGALATTRGPIEFPTAALPLFDFYRDLYNVTGGAVSPLVGRALEHLGYDPEYTLRRRTGVEITPAWDDVLSIDGTAVRATQPVMLDFGAAGKGYLVDLLADILRNAGIAEYLVDGSGDITHRGPVPCRVGLESPFDPTKAIGVVNLQNGALCASAINRRRWGEGLHHIISPVTGEPVSDVLATWVSAGTAMLADGLATALFLTEPAVLAGHFSFRFVRMLASGGVEFSADLDGELFTC